MFQHLAKTPIQRAQAALLTCAALLAILFGGSAVHAESAQRPNIILCMADDQGCFAKMIE